MRPLAAVPNLDAELDELYALPPSEFTAARNALAAKLKRAHQDSHAEVRALRKPNVVVWLANRLAREETQAVDVLLDAGARLREAHEAALAGRGGASEVGSAAVAEREAVRRLVTSAKRVLVESGERGSSSVFDRLSQTLRAAAVDEAARTLLERGRLTDEVLAAGFGSLSAVVPAARVASGAPTAAAERKALKARVQELRAAARAARDDARLRDTAAAEAERTARSLREEAGEAAAAAERAAAELAEAENALSALR